MTQRSFLVTDLPLLVAALVLALLPVVSCSAANNNATVPQGVWVRPGYKLTVAVTFKHGPRFMAVAPDGTLYVSFPGRGEIHALRDANHDGQYDSDTVFVHGYRTAHAMQWFEDALYFTQTGSIHKAADANHDGKADQVTTVIGEDKLPHSGSGHWWRSLLIHDGRIYTGIGDPGNATDVDKSNDPQVNQREKIWSFKLDGSDKQLFCSGIRNTEKLVVRPGTPGTPGIPGTSGTDEIWGMDHGSDWFGITLGESRGKQPVTNLNPPDEMNHYIKDHFYGHPFIIGTGVPRYEFLKRKDIIDLAAKTTEPQWKTHAHWAPCAMCFYTGKQFPKETLGDAFVAYHGSWNRKPPAGYQVTRVLFEDGHPYGELPYVKFLPPGGQHPLGRPVDVLVDTDGSLLISDDAGRKIYRLSYEGVTR